MKILITGHKGFIGQNMVNALKDEHELTLFEWGDTLPEFKGLDLVIHLGAISSTTETNIPKILNQNYDFSRLLLNKCQEHGVNLQYASSASVYGLTNVFDEDSIPNPQSPYAWSKYLFERYVEGFKDKWTVAVQGFRYFNVYGPLEDHKGDQASPYHKFTKQAKETGVITLFDGSEDFRRDFVHVDEVIRIHKEFFNIKMSGLWNLGTGVATSFTDVAIKIAEENNAQIKYIPMPDNIAKHYQKYTLADMRKIRKILNENRSKRNI
jgi:ADP-L-glycero-D-manno-heptose 6-epimerase